MPASSKASFAALTQSCVALRCGTTPTSVSAPPTIATRLRRVSVDLALSHRKAKNARNIVVHHLTRVGIGNAGKVRGHLVARIGPYALGVGIVRAPHQVIDTDHFARQHPRPIVFEGGKELAMKVITRRLGQLRYHPAA